ncbi:hypothetical protein MAPG_11248 [Magnaporthiopsis poae ATCC 64411]|uniref:Uncharacterized protein n=1 Tax=Magnaporthiopsis poae (strain ATCC 64411 / 73-15) TaxID=644358 RepID=A0A0C4EER9_MAGP6|nr:hypothetical protein MAPG_11248 [Magnaporthiopsis poae ATCC 64411]
MFKVRVMPETHGAILEYHGRKVAPYSKDCHKDRWLRAGSQKGPRVCGRDVMLENTCHSPVAGRPLLGSPALVCRKPQPTSHAHSAAQPDRGEKERHARLSIRFPIVNEVIDRYLSLDVIGAP